MPEIQPRWEWRIFEAFPGAFIASLGPPDVGDVESAETYIVSADSPHNVKIRDGQLDVKVLEQTRPDDLELWRPVFKQPFPVVARDLAPVWNAWAIGEPALPRASYTMEQFLDEVVAPVPELRVVPITKHRAHFTILGCSAERAMVGAARGRWDTLALEDEDPEKILLARRTLGRALPPGTSYPAMLKRIAGMGSMPPTSTRVAI